MITDRLFDEVNDRPLLETSLAKDEYHQGTTPEFFSEPGTMCKVYEDEQSPIMFVRGTPILRLDIQYVDNNDSNRNREVMLEHFGDLAQKARANGFKEIIFNTNSRALKVFVRRNLGFVESAGEMRKIL